MELAKRKGESALPDQRIVIASDTLVYRHGQYYGKPKDRNEAISMLRALGGVWHSVYTGVYVHADGRDILFYDRADVLFYPLTDEEIERYLDEYTPFDKAGAYGVQDGVVVRKYKGSFDTIMGLPTEKLGAVLERLGVKDVY